MRVDLTVLGPDRSCDVTIDAAAATPIPELAPALAEAVGAANDATVWIGDAPLRATATFGQSGLRAGVIVGAGVPARRPPRVGVLSVHVVSGPGAGRIVPLERGRLVIGRSSECDLVLSDDGASRRHAELTVRGPRLELRDLGSTNGTVLDGRAVGAAGVPITPGQLVRIGDTLLSVAGPDDPPAAGTPTDDGVLVNRAPRIATPLAEGDIELPEQGEATRPRAVQWAAALAPALAGGAIAWLADSPQFLLFVLLSPVMLLSGALGDRLHWRRSRRREARSFEGRRALAEVAIAAGLADEGAARRRAAPDPDFLTVRLGSGSRPAALRARSGAASRSAGDLIDVPITADLRTGPLGLSGPAEALGGPAAWLIGQLAALHSPADLEIAAALSPGVAPDWHWLRWLPHLRGRVASEPDGWAAVVGELSELATARRSATAARSAGWTGPWLVLVVDRAAALGELPGLAALLDTGAAVGVTAVCIDPDEAALPTCCATLARIGGETGSRLSIRTGADRRDAALDGVAPDWADALARALAPLVDAGAPADSAIPASCRLADVLGIAAASAEDVAARWAGSTGRADTVVGVGAEGPVRVDLGADGPHALIAGTTGAGKSELLQALVAGLAADHPPDEIAFLLIDYKGGAAFAECAVLPHTAGLVTDLDPHLTRRALLSLNAELRRREQLFAAAGVADLDGYRAAVDETPVARLVIVVDEFAALADELPDFVRGLVAVAQRGRSLGVHLVLATQRPRGSVSAEIRANTSLRIALRVTDPADSHDVLERADAALIPRSRPGHGYLRAGTRFECFQAARARGRPPVAGPRVEVLDEWRRLPSRADAGDGTDLRDLVALLRAAADRCGRTPARRPWLDPLPAHLPLAELDPADPAGVPVGAADLPGEQRRATVRIGLAPASATLVVGSARSGRTGFLAAAALGAAAIRSPAELQVYVIDAAGALSAAVAALPHVGTCVAPPDVGPAPTLLDRLERAVGRRLGRDPANDAAMMLLIDGWDAVLARLDDSTAARCSDQLGALIRTGAGVGLSVLVSGDRGLLAPRFAGLFGERFALRLSDRTDYGMLGLAARDVPVELPPGRGVRASDGAEIQVAHVGATPEPVEQRRVAAEIASRRRAAGPGRGVIRLRPLPDLVELAGLPAVPDRITLGLGGDTAQPLAVDLFAGAGRLLVAGPARSGRSTVLAAILAQAHRAGLAAVVAAGARSPLAGRARQCAVRVIDPDDDPDRVGPVPDHRVLLLVDDCEAFADTPAGEQLTGWVRAARAPVAAVVAGRAEDLATCYRGVAAEVRRSRCGLLLRPVPLDGELLGVRLPRRPAGGPPGRGVLVGEPAWGPEFTDGDPVPVQVARP